MNIVNTQVIHANMMVVNDVGILISGKPNIGKSELSLALIDRGHQFISDDATEIFIHNHALYGQCPEPTQGVMQINYLGIVRISQLFNKKAVLKQHRIELGIHLQPLSETPLANPLEPIIIENNFLGVSLPTFVLPSKSPEMLALLIETSIKNYQLNQCNTCTSIKE